MPLFTSFNGTNKLGAKSAFKEKVKYDLGLFEPSDLSNEINVSNTFPAIPKPLRKFFTGEMQFYGKVNESIQPVYARKDKIKPISNKDNIFALDFVARKFADLKQNFVKCTTVGSISKDDPYLSVLKPIKGYTSIEDEYKNYINKVLDAHNKSYLNGIKKINSITNFESYMNSLLEYSNLTSKTIPLSKTSFIKTNFCSMNVSGLVIELAELPYSDDTTKYNFTTSPNFKFFQNACIKHGFSIDYNAPWRIIADIDSPPMIEMMEAMGYDRTTIFTTHFNNASTLETENIKKVLYNGYSNFTRTKPNAYVIKECKTRVTTKIIPRQQISIKSLNNLIDDQTVINIFISIRNNEQESKLSNQAIQNLNKDSFSILKSLSLEAAITYIEQEMLKNQLAGTGTLNSLVLKSKKQQSR